MDITIDEESLQMKEKDISNSINQLVSKRAGEKPIVDGIIDISKYLNSEFRILWILREAREEWSINEETGKRTIGGWNLVNAFYKNASYDIICKNTTTRRELLVDYAIINNIRFLDKNISKYSRINTIEEKEKALEAFKSTAVINIKKFPGKKTSSISEIVESFKLSKNIIISQIDSYNPQIVICGNTLPLFENELDFRKGIRFPLGMGKNGYYCLPNRIYINAYHPSNKFWSNSVYEHQYISKIIEAIVNWKINYYQKT